MDSTTEVTQKPWETRETPVDGSPAGRAPLNRFFGVIADPAAWRSLFYLLLSLVTGIVYFTLTVTGLSLSAGLAVLVIGAPVALLFVATVRALSLAEGRLVEELLGVPMPRRVQVVTTGTGWRSFAARIKSWLADSRTWTSMLYMLLMLPLGIVYFTAIVLGLGLSVSLISAPVAQVALSMPVGLGLPAYWGTTPIVQSLFTGPVGPTYAYYLKPWAIPASVALGILGFFLTLWLAKGLGGLHGRLARALLVRTVDAPARTAPSADPSLAPSSATAGNATAIPEA